MSRWIQRIVLLSFSGVLVLAATGCGAFDTGIIGVGNSGNRLPGDTVDERIAEALAEHEGTPVVTDETLAEVFGAILTHAKDGDPAAALIVFKLAEEQRSEQEG